MTRSPDRGSKTATSVEEAWAVEAAAGVTWTARPWVDPANRAEAGKAARKRVPRDSHATFEPAPGRDPIAILNAQESSRWPDLVALRHSRMAASPFAYYRGTPAVMAFDLSTTPRTDILVQASGDSHLSNFGLFGSPERSLVFDANDFDETLPGPWEWDVKRLAASFVVAGRENGFSAQHSRTAAMTAVRGYREWMARYAEMRLIDIWYSKITDIDILAALDDWPGNTGSASVKRRRGIDQIFAKARSRDGLRAFESLTTVLDGRRVIVEDPPVLTHDPRVGTPDQLAGVFAEYRASMADDRRSFLERYRFVDGARKVVGVGSVGTRCFVIVLEGRDQNDPLILQAKEATESVLEPYFEHSHHENHGERVVTGQRLMQSTSDIFLGWTHGAFGQDFYIRQLWDMKGSVDTTAMQPLGLHFYGSICGWSLARAHARTGDAVAIASYLGSGDVFDSAVADFAEACADQNGRDHRAYEAAIADGRLGTI